MKMKKTLSMLLAICMLLTLVGCKSNISDYENIQNKTQMRSSFNDEVYVWESFLFPTNRTTGVQ